MFIIDIIMLIIIIIMFIIMMDINGVIMIDNR